MTFFKNSSNANIIDLSIRHPADVDLWSGGVSERPLPGSILGPTFACVIATQFSNSRRGDRFWYELPNQPSSFTPGKDFFFCFLKIMLKLKVIYNFCFTQLQSNCKN